MATGASTLTTWSQAATAAADWNTPANVQTLDGTPATFDGAPPLAGTNVLMETLTGRGLTTPPPAGCTLSQIRVKVTAKQDGTTPSVSYETLNLCDSTGALAAVDPTGVAEYVQVGAYRTDTYTFTAANLATLALTTDDVRAGTFGVALTLRRNDTIPDPAEGAAPFVDSVTVEYDYAAAAPTGGGTSNFNTQRRPMTRYQVVSYKAMPSVSSATAIFSDAPDRLEMIQLTLRTAGITLTYDGQTPTAGSVGHDFAADTNAPWVFFINATDAKRIKVIQNGGTATGTITYFTV